jgi:uncharacterized protein (TIGR02301 family)
MKRLSHLLLFGVSIVTLGSAMAWAQTAPSPESTTPPEAVQAESPPQVPSVPSSPPTEVVEDAPIDVAAESEPQWVPDINLDALREAGKAVPSNNAPRARPRKTLSDASGGAYGTGNWNQVQADAELLSRQQRRARPVDPAKAADLTRLSRVMGALHALRVSCAGRDDQTYRSRMATLLDLEAPANGDLRDPLVDAFNGGFQTHGRGAGACPSDARAQEAVLAKDGLGLARKLGNAYRPNTKVAASKLPPATEPRQNAATRVAPAQGSKAADWSTQR